MSVPQVGSGSQPIMVPSLSDLGPQQKKQKSEAKVEKSLAKQRSYANNSYEKEPNKRGWAAVVGERMKEDPSGVYVKISPEVGYEYSNSSYYSGTIGDSRLLALVAANDRYLAASCVNLIPAVVEAAFQELGNRNPETVFHVLKHTPQLISKQLQEELKDKEYAVWTAVSLAFIDLQYLWVVGCGNVRVFVCNESSVEPLTYDAVVSDNYTKHSTEKTKKNRPHECNLTRGIGGGNNSSLISRGKIARIPLNNLDPSSYLLMVSEGFTEVGSGSQICSTLQKRSLTSICPTLIASARKSHAKNDLAVLVSRIVCDTSSSLEAQPASCSHSSTPSVPPYQPSVEEWNPSWLSLSGEDSQKRT